MEFFTHPEMRILDGEKQLLLTYFFVVKKEKKLYDLAAKLLSG